MYVNNDRQFEVQLATMRCVNKNLDKFSVLWLFLDEKLFNKYVTVLASVTLTKTITVIPTVHHVASAITKRGRTLFTRIWAEETYWLVSGDIEWSWCNKPTLLMFGLPLITDGRVLRPAYHITLCILL